MQDGAESIRQMLTGGDRRSIARSNALLAAAEADRKVVPVLAALAEDPDWLVALRALDLLEKLAHPHADWIDPFKGVFIGPGAESDRWEIRLQVVRARPLFSWTPTERRRVREILLRDVRHPRAFVWAWATDSLARMAQESWAGLQQCPA